MSTRATVHFQEDDRDVAIIYRHSDGYPEGLGADLETFFSEVQETTKDTRFYDPSYLAAKWVVWDASQHSQFASYPEGKKSPLQFLGVGVCLQDPADIEYRYLVNCNGGRPKVKVEEV